MVSTAQQVVLPGLMFTFEDSPEVYSSAVQSKISHGFQSKATASGDIWSLGCIYSEAAIWIADGYTGLEEYRYQRQVEASSTCPIPSIDTFSPFHNGTEILQSVLDAHTDIEDRLRRSDNTSKNVLDTMVQEMLWEEDRPSARALLRKADIVLMKAKQKSGVGAKKESEMVRPGSRHRNEYPPPQLPSPTQPLPPLPDRSELVLKHASRRNTIDEVSSQIPHDRIFDQRTRPNATENNPARLIASNRPDSRQDINNTGRLPRADRQATRKFESWNLPRDTAVKKPLVLPQKTPIDATIPHRPTPNQGRPRALRSQKSREIMPKMSKPQEPKASQDQVTRPIVLSAREESLPPTETQARAVFTSHSNLAQASHEMQNRVPSKAESVSSSHNSSIYSQPIHSPSGQDDSFLDALSYIPTTDETPQEAKSSKRGIGFSLFPTRSRNGSSAPPRRIHDVSVPQSPSLSSAAMAPSLEYISLNTCLEWKKANKKVKKHASVPPLLSVELMEELSGRDHVSCRSEEAMRDEDIRFLTYNRHS